MRHILIDKIEHNQTLNDKDKQYWYEVNQHWAWRFLEVEPALRRVFRGKQGICQGLEEKDLIELIDRQNILGTMFYLFKTTKGFLMFDDSAYVESVQHIEQFTDLYRVIAKGMLDGEFKTNKLREAENYVIHIDYVDNIEYRHMANLTVERVMYASRNDELTQILKNAMLAVSKTK